MLKIQRWSHNIRDDMVKVVELSQRRNGQKRFVSFSVGRTVIAKKNWHTKGSQTRRKAPLPRWADAAKGAPSTVRKMEVGEDKKKNKELEDLQQEYLKIKMETEEVQHEFRQMRRRRRKGKQLQEMNREEREGTPKSRRTIGWTSSHRLWRKAA